MAQTAEVHTTHPLTTLCCCEHILCISALFALCNRRKSISSTDLMYSKALFIASFVTFIDCPTAFNSVNRNLF